MSAVIIYVRPVYECGLDSPNMQDALLGLLLMSVLMSHVVFDRLDIEDAILKEVKREIQADRRGVSPAETAALVSGEILNQDPLEIFLPKKKTRLEILLGKGAPAELNWSSSAMDDDSFYDFVESQVPFVKMRDWLFDTLHAMRSVGSDRIVKDINVRSQMVLTV